MIILRAALVAALLFLRAAPAGAEEPYEAIGRYVTGSGSCTAWIARSREVELRRGNYFDHYIEQLHEIWIVTAAHCRGEQADFIWPGGRARVTDVIGWSAPGVGHDVLIARFYASHPLPALELDAGPIDEGEPLTLIGYGGGALLSRVGPMIGRDERGRIMVQSYASPGVSGGPVLRAGTRKVVGVAILTTLDVPQERLGICLFGNCPIKPPYYATPIGQVLALVPFDGADP